MRMRLVKVSHQSRVKIKEATNEASFMVEHVCYTGLYDILV